MENIHFSADRSTVNFVQQGKKDWHSPLLVAFDHTGTQLAEGDLADGGGGYES